jgi:hypothetical protein
VALPTTGNISLTMVATELGVALPLSLNDGRTRTLAGIPTGNIGLLSLRGKSNGPTVSIQIISSGSETAGAGRRRNYFNMQFDWTGSVTPTSYSWSVSDPQLSIVNPSSRTPIVRGPSWSPDVFNMSGSSDVVCNAVISGVTYSASVNITFTIPGDI